ncbi:MAG: ATP-binding protein [Balneolaceae bacterium]
MAQYLLRLSLFLMVFLILFTLPSEAQQKAYPFLRNFEPDEYGAHNQAWDITQTKEGHILIGTGTGIVVYDGEEFQMVSGTGLMVTDLITTSDGSVFYGAANHIGEIKNDADGLPYYSHIHEKMNDEHQDFGPLWNLTEHNNELVFPTRNQLFLYSDENYDVIESQSTFSNGFAINGVYYVGESNNGLRQLSPDNTLEPAPGGEAFTDDKLPYFMLPFDDQRVLVGTVKRGLFLYYISQKDENPAGTLEPFVSDVSEFLKAESVTVGIQLKNGNYAIGTATAGVVIINQEGELIQKIDGNGGLQSEVVSQLYEDRQGNLWIALNFGFAMAEIAGSINHYDENSGLDGTVLYAEELNNQLFVATSMGLYHQNEDGFALNNEVTAATWDLSSYQDSNTNKLLVANNFGLFLVDENSTTQLSSTLTASVIQSTQNPDRIYAGSFNGLYYVDKIDDQFSDENEFLEIGNPVRQLLEDETGGIWLATQSDGIRYVNPSLNPETIKTYRSNDDYFVEHNATLHQIDGDLFVSTIDNFYKYDVETDGFVEWRNPKFEDQELDGIYKFHHKDGTLWSGASAERQYLTEYRNMFSDAPEKVESSFRSVPFSVTLFINEISDDLWFGNAHGLYQYVPNEPVLTTEMHPPQVRRIEVITDTTFTINPEVNPNPELPFGNTRLRYIVAAPWFSTGYEMEYRYLLQNYEEQWSEWTDNHIVEYTSLREGNYNFTVQARNREGLISDEAVYSLVITPPWYRSLWAYFLYFFLFLGVVYTSGKFINIYQTRRLERFNRKLERQVKKRSIKIRKQNEELKQMNVEKNEFMNIAVHDLRNPLSGIQGLADLLAKIDENPSTDEVRTLGSIIHTSSLRMFELIDKYLNVHRIEQGQITAKLEPVFLESVTRASVKRFEEQLSKKNLNIKIQTKNSPLVLADPSLIVQVLDNIISNAVKYSFEGSEITISIDRKTGAGMVTVKDQGAGISKENQKKLYSKFSQIGTKPTGGEVSIGLGLSIVKKLLIMMNGEIHCDSELGHGTAFTISLPLAKKVAKPIT